MVVANDLGVVSFTSNHYIVTGLFFIFWLKVKKRELIISEIKTILVKGPITW